MPDDNRSLLERLRALQGQQKGTDQQQQGMSDAMGRVRHKLNPMDNGIPQAPDPASLPPRQGTPVGAPTPADRAAQIAAVNAMNAKIKANDDAQKMAFPQGDQRDQPADYLRKQNGMAEGGEVGYDNHDDDYLKDNGMAKGGMAKFPKLKKRFGK